MGGIKVHFWKDKKGKELTYQQFMNRWKKGIQQVTPIQQVRMQVKSTLLMIIGFLAGIIICITKIKTLWWLLLILLGGLGINVMQLISMKQKVKMFEDIQKQMEGDLI